MLYSCIHMATVGVKGNLCEMSFTQVHSVHVQSSPQPLPLVTVATITMCKFEPITTLQKRSYILIFMKFY